MYRGYLGSHAMPHAVVDLAARPRLDPRLTPVLTTLEVLDGNGLPTAAVGCGEPAQFRISYDAPRDIVNPSFGIIFSNAMGMPLFFLQTRLQSGLVERVARSGQVMCRLDEMPLMPGEYLLTIGCLTGEQQFDLLELTASVSVEPRDF